MTIGLGFTSLCVIFANVFAATRSMCDKRKTLNIHT